MILSILENKKEEDSLKQTAMVYLGISIFCLVFFLIYNQFSHGVHSFYMTWLFAWPLVLGTVPCAILLKCNRLFHKPGRLCINLYHSGVAALTVSSLLRGIFEIAGTASNYQEWLTVVGGIMLICGIIAYLFRK